jgi:hypothetical protein
MRPKRNTSEHLESCIYGVDYYGNVNPVWVYVKGRAVYLSGPDRRHLVHFYNEGTREGWRREAELIWSFARTLDVPAVLLGSEVDRSARAEIQKQAEEIKRQRADEKAKASQ